jgi:hypothetical protein
MATGWVPDILTITAKKQVKYAALGKRRMRKDWCLTPSCKQNENKTKEERGKMCRILLDR